MIDNMLPKWCSTLHDEIFNWLMSLQQTDSSGSFKFCSSGNILVPTINSGLDTSALALKILYMSGTLDRISPEHLNQWVQFIQSFQKEEVSYGFLRHKRLKGFFIDPQFLSYVDKKGFDIKTRRAVTRQACAALMCAGCCPKLPIESVPDTTKQIHKYLGQLDWSDPWGAGSHASHLVFFLKLNHDYFQLHRDYETLMNYIFEWLNSIRDPDTKLWYTGNPDLEHLINGAMKVLTAYAVIDRPIEYPDHLIDFCLNAADKNKDDGCHNTDILFILHYCNRFSYHRHEEIENFCRQRINVIEQFRKSDGGFSFYPNSSQTSIYGVPVSKGYPVSDIHGTALFLWALIMATDILGYSSSLPWRLPIN